MKKSLALGLLVLAALAVSCSLSEPPKKRAAKESSSNVIETPETVAIPADVQAAPPETAATAATTNTVAPVRKLPINLANRTNGLQKVKPRTLDRSMLISPKLRTREDARGLKAERGLRRLDDGRTATPPENAPVESPHTDLE